MQQAAKPVSRQKDMNMRNAYHWCVISCLSAKSFLRKGVTTVYTQSKQACSQGLRLMCSQCVS